MLSRPFVAELQFGLELPAHNAAIESIAAEAFGPGRHARAAARVREMAPHAPDLSFVACLNGEVIGSVRQTPVRIGDRPALMLGPLAVRPQFKSLGIGRALMKMAAEAAAAAGEEVIFLVGDRAYYVPLGYVPVSPGSIDMPGPVDQARILALPLVPGAEVGLNGKVMSRPA